MEDEFSFGASFVPYAKSEDMPMSEWENDIKTMKGMGFNTFRSFVAWDRIERQEGVCDFSKTDYVLELARKYGMKVVLNVGGAFSNVCGIYPPRWIIRDYKCQHVTHAPGSFDGKPFGPRRFICMDDPVYVGKSETFIAKAVERYKSEDALAAWSVWNEPILGYPCLCRYTLENFRNWLRKKYRDDLDLLNTEWGSEFPVDYRTWDEVEPGLEAGFGGGYMAAFDWMTFSEEKLTANVRRVNDLVKRVDPHHSTTVNIITYAYRNQGYGNNIAALGDAVDIVGYSHYLFDDKPYETAASLDMMRSVSRDPERKYWIIETEAGPMMYYGGEFGYFGSGESGKRAKANWQSVGRGVKSILLWKWRGRISDKQTDEYNLMAWDGSITERARLNSEVARSMHEIASEINPKTNTAEVAVLNSVSSRRYVNLDDGSLDIKKRWQDSLLGAYKVLWDLNVQADFIAEEQIRNLSRYKLLVIPLGAVIPAGVAKEIASFVERGGVAIADYYLGVQKENCRINYCAPGDVLDKVFGCYYNDIISTASKMPGEIVFSDFPAVRSSEVFSELHPYAGAEVVGKYECGTPAVVRNNYGSGTAVLCGSSIFAGYVGNENPHVYDLMKRLLESWQIKLKFDVTAPDVEQAKNIEVCELADASGDNPVYIVINHNTQPVDFSLAFTDGAPADSMYEALSRRTLAVSDNRIRLQMPEFGTTVLMSQEIPPLPDHIIEYFEKGQ